MSSWFGVHAELVPCGANLEVHLQGAAESIASARQELQMILQHYAAGPSH